MDDTPPPSPRNLRFVFRSLETSDPEAEACLNFWRGFIELAISDILTYDPAKRSSFYHFRESLRFFLSQDFEYDRHFTTVCDMAFLNPDAVRDYVLNLVKRKGLQDVLRNPENYAIEGLRPSDVR